MSTTLQRSMCDGVTASSAGCKPVAATNCGTSVCLNATACKTTCAADGDCLSGYGCLGGSCVAKKADGTACSAGTECVSGICLVDANGSGPACRGCPGRNNGCPQQIPGCGDNYECAYSCGAIRDPSGCVGAAFDCTVEPYIPTVAIQCDTSSRLFHCGGLTSCPPWMVCSAGGCLVAGGRPCIQSSDCYTGTCSGGVCQSTGSGGACLGSFTNECAGGLICDLKMINTIPQYLSVCQ